MEWEMLNIHPSLLPSFKGSNAHEQVLDAGVTVTGCTVHFVAEDVDAGQIVLQEAVPVKRGDTIETLSERVKLAEHKIFQPSSWWPVALYSLEKMARSVGSERNEMSLSRDGASFEQIWPLQSGFPHGLSPKRSKAYRYSLQWSCRFYLRGAFLVTVKLVIQNSFCSQPSRIPKLNLMFFLIELVNKSRKLIALPPCWVYLYRFELRFR